MATEEISIEEGQFHCVRCSSVFSAPLELGRPSLCSICGNSPQRDSRYTSVASITTAVDKDGNHGVAGKDVADFVSMKMVRRKKQVRLAVVSWFLLLATVAGVSIYLQNTSSEPIIAVVDQSEDINELRAKTTEAYGQSIKNYTAFIGTADLNQRSEYVVNGVGKLLKMQNYYETTINPELVGGMVNLGLAYNDDGEYPRLEILAMDSQKRLYELVFWNQGDGWKLDWEQYVRYQVANWTEFLLAPQIGVSERFKLYVRRRYSSQRDGDLNLIFYQPNILAGVRNQESPQVNVGPEHPAYQPLKEAFEMMDAGMAEGEKKVVGKKDSNGLIRVTASLSYALEGDGEKPKLELDEIKAFHWMEYDPVKD
ncbi:hypothetical protein [Rubritalea sp.]|uniref:hypothetical protein n=1 Tax=Rubritalea sp. TaxID=2109375 RepID=UPI003EF190F6